MCEVKLTFAAKREYVATLHFALLNAGNLAVRLFLMAVSCMNTTSFFKLVFGLSLFTFAAVHHLAIAGDDITPTTLTAAKAAAMATVPAEKVLLMHNGKVISGMIKQSSTGYVVIKPEGQMILPFEHVRLEAEDLEDAYLQQRNALPDHSAAAHCELARWCLTYGLKDQAQRELQEALRREPGSVTAKNMLQRLSDQLLATNDLPILKEKNGRYSMLGDVKPVHTLEALGGLPRDAAGDFVSKVQPLLVNRCATAGCHGPGSGQDFELQRAKVGKGNPKSQSERNLAAVLARIDRDRPLSSPLLTKLRGDSKSSATKATHGGLSAEQTQVLRQWVTSLSNNSDKKNFAEKSDVQGPAFAKDATFPVGSQLDLVDESLIGTPIATDEPPKTSRRKEPKNKPVVDELDADKEPRSPPKLRKPDAFDPDEFNSESGL